MADTSDEKIDFSFVSFSNEFPLFRDLDTAANSSMQVNGLSFSSQTDTYRGMDTGSFGFDNSDGSLSAFGARDEFRAFGGPSSNYSHHEHDSFAPFSNSRYGPEPPRIPGGYLQPAYHFLTDSRPVTVFASLLTYLSVACRFDTTPKPDKYKIKCTAYHAATGARLPFVVRIFSLDGTEYDVSSAKQYAVEFMKRAGDTMHFSQIYRECKAHLEQEGYTVVSTCKHTPIQPPPSLGGVTVDQAKLTMKSLLQMSSSECTDVKSQAIEALSVMTRSQDSKIQSMMVEEGGFKALLSNLSSSCEDIHRSAISGVANLTKERAVACKAALASTNCGPLFALASSETAQVLRETGRAFENIIGTLGKESIDLPFRQALDTIAYCKDPAAQACIARLGLTA